MVFNVLGVELDDVVSQDVAIVHPFCAQLLAGNCDAMVFCGVININNPIIIPIAANTRIYRTSLIV